MTFRLWPWRRTAQLAQPAQPSLRFGDADAHVDRDSLSDPYSSVSVSDERGGPGTGGFVAFRNFTDRNDAIRAQAAWQRHDPGLTVRLRHDTRSSPEPSYEGSYLHVDGTWRSGQPAEIDALIAENLAAVAQERAAQRAREAEQRRKLDAWVAEMEARRPRDVVVAEAGDDSPFAHHDKFVNATQTHVLGRPEGKVRFRFTEFTGLEPKPVSTARGDLPDATESQRAQQRLIDAEYDAATAEWAKAVYRRQAAPVLRSAAVAWPKVAEAVARIKQAWSDLDHPPHGWEVAVKQLLDAHRDGRSVVGNWEYCHEGKLATVGAELAGGRYELAEMREQLGTALGIDGMGDWLIGHGRDRRGDGLYIEIEDGARKHLADLVATQRQLLAEYATAAGRGQVTT
jgi:hypothetical protein